MAGAGYFAYNRHQQEEQRKVADAQRASLEASLARNDAELQAAKARQEETNRLIAELSRNHSAAARPKLAELQALAQANAEAIAAKEAERATLAGKLKAVPAGGSAPSSAPAPGGTIMTPEQINAANVSSVILIETTWKVVDGGTGSPIFLYNHKNDLGACPQEAEVRVPAGVL